MSRSQRLLVAVATSAIAFAACSSSPSTAPGSSTTGGGGGGGGGASTPAPGGSGITAGGAFGPAANALDNLDSYKFDVEITSSDSSTFGAAGTTSFTGVANNKPTQGQQLDEVEKDATGNVTSELHLLVIGQNAWSKTTASDPYTAFPAAGVTGMIAGLAAFQPQKLFATAFGTLGQDYQLVGTETKNGVNCQHFSGNESIGAFFGALSGVQGSWQSDVWLAVDGGYLVSSNVQASGATATSAGSFAIDVEITNINDPANVLQPPS